MENGPPLHNAFSSRCHWAWPRPHRKEAVATPSAWWPSQQIQRRGGRGSRIQQSSIYHMMAAVMHGKESRPP
ncbi:Os07g0543202 [Oryza sativa Japonica Group]|uniref:Os07g0543202 protein n=1 Tax=Oryza sativa subsp. japonica TaxID=39947 RepID=A0A0P0X742_ORYSJ|nr:Os07g0543202 [Oryza sativa Japonica Group]